MAQPQGEPPPGAPHKLPSSPDPLSAAASRWDANLDGIFTCDEWKQFATILFTLADRNKDGFLNAAEFQNLRASERLFASADIPYFDDNQDGRVSKHEFVNKPNPFFARYDQNKDCLVTPNELKASSGSKIQGPPDKGGPGGMRRGGGNF